jgi:hypothetical protein
MNPPQPPVLHLAKHTGMLLAFSNAQYKFTGDPERLRSAYWKVQRHCLLFGWWSVLSFFIVNPACILLNAFNWMQYKKKYRRFLEANGLPVNPVAP